jgi:anti-sigma regulatory factor (Ser/Thr protein kinase)
MKKYFLISSPNEQIQFLKSILDWVDEIISTVEIPEGRKWIPMLCIEEYVTNLLKYANLQFPSKVGIEIIHHFETRLLELIIEDHGAFFAIESHPIRRKKGQIGGGGIPLIKSLVQIYQERIEDCNYTKFTYAY